MRCCLYLSFLLILTIAAPAIGADDFTSWISKRCLTCHSGLSPSGNLDLTSQSKAEMGGDSGTAWIANAPFTSLIWEAVSSGSMPPDEPLSEPEIAELKRWIEGGQLWPTAPIDPIARTSDLRAGYDWWAFQPLGSIEKSNKVKITYPSLAIEANALGTPEPANTPIDQFIDQRLSEVHLHRSPRAPLNILERRLHYGITGLPPNRTAILETNSLNSSQESESPTGSEKTDDYVELVDKLLSSPEYGEKFGRYWLDLVRFGETNGFEYDEPRNNFWRYRNWVIQAFNQDMPYDQFVQMQLAGDSVAEDEADGKIAMGFLVAGPHNTTRPTGNDLVKVAMEEDELEELVGTIGQTFLGMTINCARCHDHKFDPISQQNYYEFAANFAGVNHGEVSVTMQNSAEDKTRYRRILDEIKRLQSEIDSIYESESQRITVETKTHFDSLQHLPQPVLQWPTPLAGRFHLPSSWTASTGSDGNSENLVDVGLNPEPGLRQGGIHFDGTFYLAGQRLDQPSSGNKSRTIKAKTLSAWVLLDRLDQRGGGVLTLQNSTGQIFDSIVYGELEPNEWLSGSDNHRRSKPVKGTPESDALNKPVHIAITYAPDGHIQLFRNGQLYGESYVSSPLLELPLSESKLLLGLRHTPAGGNRHLHGTVFYAALFDRALSQAEIQLQSTPEFLEMQKRIALGSDKNPKAIQTISGLLKQVAALQHELNQRELASKVNVYTSTGRQIGERRIYRRGDVSMPGPPVEPSALDALGESPPFPNIDQTATDKERRLAVAKWLTSKENALFARVIANRVWMFHMGQSLVKTPSDFGFNAGEPSHPELLDYLAETLIDNDFRLKPLHRAILLSETYRQRSTPSVEANKLDAPNQLYWRKQPERLEAEEVRDSMLAISGRLGLVRHSIGYRDMQQKMEKGTNIYRLLDLSTEIVQQRTIYRFSPRGSRNLFLDNFDCPDPSVATPQRSQTTTPLQALSLLNNSLVYSVCDFLEKSIKESVTQSTTVQSDEELLQSMVDTAYQRILLRPPSSQEQSMAMTFVQKHGLSNFCRVLFNTNEFLYVQ